ncbi:hypothetical protein B0H14DRAFT_2714060 [Mycena olivaceomarginata]|nr:hypothetical protein B0H14DRAFT_2714060 [Mycena olivaceomarginata]
MFSRVLTVFALALAVAATNCPNCPATDLLGNTLVAASGGTRGTPRFCGYSPDATWPSIKCFYTYDTGAGFGPDASCPAVAPIADVC